MKLQTLVEAHLKESLRVIGLLSAIRFYELHKYDMYKIQIALLLEDVETIVSPHQKLLNIVLSQSDFVKKQRDIGLFVGKYCRIANIEEDEDKWWYYCPVTNTKLLPTFFFQLSEAYFNDQYTLILDEICAERGTKSDDGDMIVDKYSGFVIRQLELEEMEGFDAAGRPLTSYDLLQRDKGDILIDIFEMKKDELYKDTNAQTISRVIAALDQSMGISVLSEQEFIIRHTVRRLTQELKSKKKYMAQVATMKKKGKGMKPYVDYVNEFLLYYTLGYYLIALQTMTPSVQSVKTFGTGCKKSFKGYPTELIGNMSSLDYVSCVAMHLKSDTEPWNILPSITAKVKVKIKGKGKEARITEEKKLLASVSQKLKIILDRKILKEDEVQDKINGKRFYLKTTSEEDLENIPIAIDVKGWSMFLPPLVTQHVENLSPVNTAFEDLLLQEIATGNPSQFDRLHKLYGLMFYYSLGIQESIQQVVNKVSIILTNKGTSVPYLENACCNEGTINTYNYFVDGNNLIEKYNRIIGKLQTLYFGVREAIIAPYLDNPDDTKMKYTILGSDYSEKTIYHSFLYFCKNLNIRMTDEIGLLCGDVNSTVKSDEFSLKTLYNDIQNFFDALANSKRKDEPDPWLSRIKLLKRDGFVFTNEALVNLVNAVNKQRIVDIDLHPTIVSAKYALEGVIKYLQEKDNPLICGKEFLTKLHVLMDRFYVEYTEASDEVVIDLLAYIKEFNIVTVDKLLATINKNKPLKRELKDFIKEILPSHESKGTFKQNKARQEEYILNWKERGDGLFMKKTDETAYTAVEFLKINIVYLAKVYPNIIKNQESFKNKKVPKHWKLSKDFHIGDVQEIIFKEYNKLEQFYGDKDLEGILSNVILKTDNLLMLMNATPFFAENDHKTIINGTILKELMFFYLLCCLNIYLDSVTEIPVELVIDDPKEDDEEPVKESSLAVSLEAELLAGKEEERDKKISNLLVIYLEMMQTYKGALNYSNKDVIEKVLKAKEKEKNKITTRLGDLTVEEREIENIMKNQRLGEWGLGQTKALFVYDQEQYNKERRELEKDTLIELKMGRNDDVTDMNREIYKLDEVQETDVSNRINAEVYALNTIAEDDDMGNDDDQVQLDYGDL